jgi:hypothetical protein
MHLQLYQSELKSDECDPAKWNSQAGRAIGTKEEIKSLNNYLDSLQSKVRDAHQALIDANQPVTTESLQNQFTGKTQKSCYLMQLFTEHNAKVKALIGNGFEANTLKGYNTSEKHLAGYLQSEYGKTDMEISLDIPLILTIDAFLVAKYGSDAAICNLYNHLDGSYLLCFSQTRLISESGLIAHDDIERISRLAA